MLWLQQEQDGLDKRVKYYAQVRNHRGDEIVESRGPYWDREQAERELSKMKDV